MQPIIAESAPHRARLLWIAAGLAAAITIVAATRPVVVVAPRGYGIAQIGRCGQHRTRIATPPVEVTTGAPAAQALPTIRVVNDHDARVITVHPRPPAMIGDLQITY